MFGRNDDQQNNDNQHHEEATQEEAVQTDNPAPEQQAETIEPASDSSWDHPGTPLQDNQADTPDKPEPQTINDVRQTGPVSSSPSHNASNHHLDNSDAPDDLADIKQKALGQLQPLVGHLDQTPEEKFRTLMMMIQASDDQSMVKEAYEAAQAITDEKVKAQALLDIVNEINYFTAQHES